MEHARTTGDASAITGAEGMLWPTLRQDGPSVFRWAVWSMAKVAREALDAAGITIPFPQVDVHMDAPAATGS